MNEIINALLMGESVNLPNEGYYATIKPAIEAKGHKLYWNWKQGNDFTTCSIFPLS